MYQMHVQILHHYLMQIGARFPIWCFSYSFSLPSLNAFLTLASLFRGTPAGRYRFGEQTADTS